MTRVEALAQPEKGLFIDLIAQHEGLADELAQDELCSSQEPVAWRLSNEAFDYQITSYDEEQANTYIKNGWHLIDVLYTSPPKEQQSCDKRPWGKPWVSLTDDDISFVLSNLQVMYNRPPTTDSRTVFARAIEAKLKELNT